MKKMIIKLKVIPNSKQAKVTEDGKAYLTSSPEKGKTNKELIELLSEHFSVSKSRIRIIRGSKSRHKVVEIDS